jgi:hypothetical protein
VDVKLKQRIRYEPFKGYYIEEWVGGFIFGYWSSMNYYHKEKDSDVIHTIYFQSFLRALTFAQEKRASFSAEKEKAAFVFVLNRGKA